MCEIIHVLLTVIMLWGVDSRYEFQCTSRQVPWVCSVSASSTSAFSYLCLRVLFITTITLK